MSLVAAIPCRVQSTRLYAKPLQYIDVEKRVTLLEYLVSQIQQLKEVKNIVLAVSVGEENVPFQQLAKKTGISFVLGDPEEVLSRMILAAQSVKGETILRITSECPFIYFENFSEIYLEHVREKADLTVIENLPDGAYYELLSTRALVRSYECGHRGAWVTLFINQNPQKFKIIKRLPPSPLRRPDLRVTVDYPEDLVAIRKVYKDLGGDERFPPIGEIIRYIDSHPEVRKLLCAHHAGAGRIWA